MGFYAPAQLIRDVKKHGVIVNAIDVNESFYDNTLEFVEHYVKPDSPCHHNTEAQLRLGLRSVKGLSRIGAKSVVAARQAGHFTTVQDLVFRSGINQKDLEALAAADVLKKISGDRHRAFWQASGIKTMGLGKQAINKGDQVLFFSDQEFDSDFGVDVLLPVVSEEQNIIEDYNTTGFTLKRHPVALFRAHLNNFNVSRADELVYLADEDTAKVAGLVTCRQRPMTASGVTFLTLEDEAGYVNVVVWPALGEQQRSVMRQASLMGIVGHVQKSNGVVHLIARELADLSHWLSEMEFFSRDFT
jgi:error-prone DNA polymerase